MGLGTDDSRGCVDRRRSIPPGDRSDWIGPSLEV
jgi:hypothetical protein